MGRVDTARNQGQYPTGTGARPVSQQEIGALSAEQGAMAGFADLAGAVASMFGKGAVQKRDEQMTQSSFSAGKARWVRRNDEFTRGLRDDPDYEGYLQKYNKLLPNFQKEIIGIGTTKRAREGLKNFMVEKSAAQRVQVAQIALAKETDYQRASTLNAVNTHILDGDAGDAISALKRAVSSGYISAEEAQRRGETIEQECDWNGGIECLESDPEAFLRVIDNEDFLPSLDTELRSQLKSAARQVIARNERELREQKRALQEKTASQFLADLWENKLTDPQVITNAVSKGFITATDAKYLRAELLKTEPTELNLKNLADVKEAITDIGTGAKTRNEALSVLYKNLSGIDPATGKSLTNEIFAEHDRGDAEMKKEGRNLMEDLIRDKDPMSGFFSDDARQILGTSEAILMLDAEITKAATMEKPLTRREILIKAVGIGRQIKNKIKREEGEGVPPGFIPEEKTKTEGELTLKDLDSIFSKATIDGKPTVDRLTVYKEAAKLKSVFRQMTYSERLKVYEDLAGGIKADSILARYQKEAPKSPYPEYPDAFQEDGVWKVTRDGKKYRIEE